MDNLKSFVSSNPLPAFVSHAHDMFMCVHARVRFDVIYVIKYLCVFGFCTLAILAR